MTLPDRRVRVTGSLLHLLLQWSGLERYQRSRAVTRVVDRPSYLGGALIADRCALSDALCAILIGNLYAPTRR